MDQFVLDFHSVFNWLMDIFNGIVSFFSSHPVSLMIMVAGLVYLVIDRVLFMFSGHQSVSTPRTHSLKAQGKAAKVKGIAQQSQSPQPRPRRSFLRPFERSKEIIFKENGHEIKDTRYVGFMGGKAFTRSGGGGRRLPRGSSEKSEKTNADGSTYKKDKHKG